VNINIFVANKIKIACTIEVMNWVLLALVSAVTASLSRILQKICLKDEKSDVYAFSFVFQVIVAVFFLGYSLLSGNLELPVIKGLEINWLMMVVLYSLANVFIFKAFQLAEASEVSIVLASNIIWSALAAGFLLNERLSSLNVMGMIAILLGIGIINYTKKTFRISKGHWYALGAAIFFGVAFVNDAFILKSYSNIPVYLIFAFALPGVFCLIYRPQAVKNIRSFFEMPLLKLVLLCCFFYTLSSLSIFSAFKAGGMASIILPIQQTSLILTVVLSYLFLGEKEKLTQKILGTILVFGGVLMLL
jgi:bacterial/archaeal transporter family protein